MGLGYTCKMAIEEGWFEKARNSGVWTIKIKYDPRNLDYIYLPGVDGLNFIKCDLLPQYHQHFKGLSERKLKYSISLNGLIYNRVRLSEALKSETFAAIDPIIDKETKITDALRDPDLSKAEIFRMTDENRLDQKSKSQVIWKLGEEAEVKANRKVVPFRQEEPNDQAKTS